MQALTTLFSEKHTIREGKHSSRFSIGRFFRNLHFGRPRGFQIIAEIPHHEKYPDNYDHWNKLGGYGWGLPKWVVNKFVHQHAIRLGYRKARGVEQRSNPKEWLYEIAVYQRHNGRIDVHEIEGWFLTPSTKVSLSVDWSEKTSEGRLGVTPLREENLLMLSFTVHRSMLPFSKTFTYGLNPYFGGQPTAPTDTEYHLLRGVF